MGEKANHVCALVRRVGRKWVLVAVQRFLSGFLSAPDGLPLGGEVWSDTNRVIPFANAGARYYNIYTMTDEEHNGATALQRSGVFARFPVALLHRIT